MSKERMNKQEKNSVSPVTFGPKHHFFGYYDKSPWNRSGKFMLAMETDFIDHLPKKNETATIGIIDLRNKKFRALSKTRAWNWQQGCMLQWLPPTYDRYIIYNDREGNRYISIIMNVKTKKKRTIPFPIYAVHPNGRYALSLNFSRLNHTRRGYGYAGIPDPWLKEIAPKEDGIYLIDLKNEKKKLIISLEQLYNFKHIGSMEGGKHWVNHITFNRDGSRFCFLHRWEIKGEGFYTRLITTNPDGTDLYCLSDSGNFSHFDWKDSRQLLGWGNQPSRMTTIKKSRHLSKLFFRIAVPIYRSLFSEISQVKRMLISESYLLLTDKTSEIKRLDIADVDGHCSFSPNGKWVVTDTYPDKDHYRTPILYNWEKRKSINLGRFYSIPDKKYTRNEKWDISEMRCDLHPRWNRDGTKVCIDSVHEGSRQMYILDTEK